MTILDISLHYIIDSRIISLQIRGDPLDICSMDLVLVENVDALVEKYELLRIRLLFRALHCDFELRLPDAQVKQIGILIRYPGKYSLILYRFFNNLIIFAIVRNLVLFLKCFSRTVIIHFYLSTMVYNSIIIFYR